MREQAVFTQLLDKVVDIFFKEEFLVEGRPATQFLREVLLTDFCSASGFIAFKEYEGVNKCWVPLGIVLSIREVSEIEQRARAQEFGQAI